jgi:hypothetical protein
MTSRPVMAIVLAAACVSGGCADLMARSTIAPDWFQAKAIEVKGEGYPELAEVPASRNATLNPEQWEAEADRLRQAQRVVDANTASNATPPTDAEIRASAAQLRALLEPGAPPPAEVAPQTP